MREVAHAVAAKLGLTVVDEEIVTAAAAEAGVEPEVVADIERRSTFMERLFERLGSSPDANALSLAAGGGAYHTPVRGASDELRELIRSAIEETAAKGDVVIVAHAASHALAAQPGVLRVLVTASPEIRRSRVAEAQGLGEHEAAKAIEANDAARAEYLNKFYGTKRELPTQYDLVINTDRVGTDDAVALVVLAAGGARRRPAAKKA
jgi:hypothetical protein